MSGVPKTETCDEVACKTEHRFPWEGKPLLSSQAFRPRFISAQSATPLAVPGATIAVAYLLP
jgi:hypothetical protein